MRPVCAIAALFLFAAVLIRAETAVTLILQFDESYSQLSLNAMEREVDSIIGKSGIRLDWRLRGDIGASESFSSMVVVRFRGACTMPPVPYLIDERGYYAFTHTSDGEVLPFSEVECDKVASSIRPVMSVSQWKQRDMVLGRALGRVVAHELYHMLAKTDQHGKTGVAKDVLSPSQLVSKELRLQQAELDRLRQH